MGSCIVYVTCRCHVSAACPLLRDGRRLAGRERKGGGDPGSTGLIVRWSFFPDTGGDESELAAASDQDHPLPNPGGVYPRFFWLEIEPVLVPDLPLILQRIPAIPDSIDGEVSGEHSAVRLFGREWTNEASRRYLPVGDHVVRAVEAGFD